MRGAVVRVAAASVLVVRGITMSDISPCGCYDSSCDSERFIQFDINSIIDSYDTNTIRE